MIYFFNFFFHTKVTKLVQYVEPDHFQPFGILLKGFVFYIIISQKKKDFGYYELNIT